MESTRTLSPEERTLALDLLDGFHSMRRVADAVLSGDVEPTLALSSAFAKAADANERRALKLAALSGQLDELRFTRDRLKSLFAECLYLVEEYDPYRPRWYAGLRDRLGEASSIIDNWEAAA